MAVVKDLVGDAAPVNAWAWGDYLLFPVRRRLLRAGEPVDVEDRVLDLLVLLLQHRERALDRREIIQAIWGSRPVSDATLRQLVYKARRAVGDDGEHQAVICTIYGRSLQWIAPVEEVSEGDAGAGSASPQVAQPSAGPTYPAVERRRLPDRRAPANPDTPIDTQPVAPSRRGIRAIPARIAWLLTLSALLMLVGGAVVWTILRADRPDADGTSAAHSDAAATLAVLPFLDLDPNQNQRYVSDGLTEELINRLARMPRLRVTARTSAFAFRDRQANVRGVARQLGVAHVLEGSVQRSGQTWRVRVALVDAHGGYALWANEYNVASGDLLALEDRIAHDVVATLYPKLDAAALAAGARSRVDPAAHDYYLVGLQYLSRRDTADIYQAIAYFDRAKQVDPNYPDAWSGVAIGYAILRDYNSDAPPDTHYDDALAAATRAVGLDPGSARGHMVLGQLHEEHWQWPSARREFELALKLDPSNATAHQWYAIYFWFTGDMPSALRQMRMAYALDPLSPIINADLTRALLYAGDVDGAIRQGKASVALAPRFELAHLFLAEALAGKRRYADAVREIQAGIALTPQPAASDDLAFLGQMQWAAGDSEGARRQLEQVQARARQHYVSGVSLATLEWPLGQKDLAFAHFNRAVADHDHLLMTVSGLRDEAWCSDPRFGKLLASMNLPVH